MKINTFKSVPTWAVGLFIMVLFIINASFDKKTAVSDQIVRTYHSTIELEDDAKNLEGRGYRVKAMAGGDDRFVVAYEKIK